jgi:hypothetical protein
VRCPSCDSPNDDGAAFCANCAAPLTAYSATSPADADPARTAARVAEMAERPTISLVIAAADIVAALVPVVVTLRAVSAAPELSQDATNYMGHAFGGLRAVLTAAVMLPLAAGLAGLAWGTITQKAWAWSIHVALFGLLALVSMVTLRSNPAVSLLELALVGAAAWQWFQPKVRRWYGHE